jgi:hypothetical protein
MAYRTALGLSIHTGWAVCVVVAPGPIVVLREELALLDPAERFVFHRAAEMPVAAGKKSVERARKVARTRGDDALARIVRKENVRRAAILAKPGEMPPYEEIVAAHPRIHTAEGLFYRDVLAAALEAQQLREIRLIAPAEVEMVAACELVLEPARIAELLAAAGRAAGRPWGKDQKLAALAAWTILRKT